MALLKGYEEEAAKLLSQQKLSMAQTFVAQVWSGCGKGAECKRDKKGTGAR